MVAQPHIEGFSSISPAEAPTASDAFRKEYVLTIADSQPAPAVAARPEDSPHTAAQTALHNANLAFERGEKAGGLDADCRVNLGLYEEAVGVADKTSADSIAGWIAVSSPINDAYGALAKADSKVHSIIGALPAEQQTDAQKQISIFETSPNSEVRQTALIGLSKFPGLIEAEEESMHARLNPTFVAVSNSHISREASRYDSVLTRIRYNEILGQCLQNPDFAAHDAGKSQAVMQRLQVEMKAIGEH